MVITVAGGEKEILLTSLLSQLAYHIAGEALSPMVLLIHSFQKPMRKKKTTKGGLID